MPTSRAYRCAVRTAKLLLPVATRFDAKLRQGHRARSGALGRLCHWGDAERDPSRPLAWFHAPSVGEGLQAEAVLRRVKERHPEWQYVYTFFSPSAEGLARRIGATVSDYLPYDTRHAARKLIRSLRPSALIFSKLDVWPELATTASEHGTRVGLVAATVRPGSGRLHWPTRAVLAPGYRALTAVGAVAQDDARRLERLGTRPDAISIVGDPRYDSVLEKVAAVRADDPLLAFGKGAPTLVAGSTWPGDEAVLLPAFVRVRALRPDARLILVPHEPSPEHLAAVEAAALRLGLPTPVRLSAAVGPAPFLLVDRVGVLATLYGTGIGAYVGGGFQSAGLHSALEPAAWGRPVMVGPNWEENRDAAGLVAAGGAVTIGRSGSVPALAERWDEWIADEPLRRDRGHRALATVERGRGAADRSATLVEHLVLAD